MTGIKAIETEYAGYRFRSRLEARWAVFFDVAGVVWEYEKEGFDLGSAGWYLPDFWFPISQMWAEVKPVALTQAENEKVLALARGGKPVLLLIGTPDNKPYYAMRHEGVDDDGKDYYKVVSATCDYADRASLAAKQARFEFGQSGAPSEWTRNG